RPGRSSAPRSLASPLALAWRLQRVALFWWCVAIFVFTVGYGTLASQVEAFAAEMALFEEMLAGVRGTAADGFLAVAMNIWAVVVAVYAVTAVLRVRAEERAGTAEPVLAAAVSPRSY